MAKDTNYFKPFDSNTICDITGFKVKFSEVKKQWDGLYVIPEAWSMRQPQDFPPVVLRTVVFEDVRFEQEPAVEAAGSFEVI